MKRFPIFFLLVIIGPVVKAQGNLPTTQGHWLFSIQDPGEVSPVYSNYTLFGDTTISTTEYKKLYEGSPPAHSSSYLGALREENRVVYFYPMLSNQEYILYDFNLIVGEVVNSEFGMPSGYTSIVEQVDSLEMADGYHRTIRVSGNPPGNEWWIEGIGSQSRLLNPVIGPNVSGLSQLVCMVSEGDYSFPEGYGSCYSSVKNEKPIVSLISIQPNPFQNSTQITFEAEIQQLQLYNALGVLVKEEDVVPSSTFTLERDGLPSGVYVLQLCDEKGQSVFRKLVAN